MKQKSLIEMMAEESASYLTIDGMEKLVDSPSNLEHLPVQPLYVAMKNLSTEALSELLPRLSIDQRQAMLDLDLWFKDKIDMAHFERWLPAYANCSDPDVVAELAKSSQFLIYLKGTFNIWTFDAEEPVYPEHDNYFLTDDNLLLFEFDGDYPYIDVIKKIIQQLYYEMGVDNAYSFLFKLVADSYEVLEEEEYQLKKKRLDDYGIVDYFDSLEFQQSYNQRHQLDSFIQKKVGHTGELDIASKTQNLPPHFLSPFRKEMEDINAELLLLKNEKRLEFVKFSFLRLVNANLAFNNALKESSIIITQVGEETRRKLELGLQYIKKISSSNIPEEGVFAIFDFRDLYRVGRSCVFLNQKLIKQAQDLTGVPADAQSFYGVAINEFIDLSLDETVKIKNWSDSKPHILKSMEDYELWNLNIKTFMDMAPFIKAFFQTFLKLKEESQLSDMFYINYQIAEIDFEAIILSALANFSINKINNTHELKAKLGISVNEFNIFYKQFYNDHGELNPQADSKILDMIHLFVVEYGMDKVVGIDLLLHAVLRRQLDGYNLSELTQDDYRHVGGPIILKN